MTKTCLYTLTPDRDFVLDSVPGHPDVFVALGAAHGFKFAALFGEIMRDLALDRPVTYDLSPFMIDRDALTTADPPRAWLV
jgi:sarcosine oxidase